MGWLIVIGSILGGALILGLALTLVGGNAETKECPKCGGVMEQVGAMGGRNNKVIMLYECGDCGEQIQYEETYNSN